jgi:hypothetical protein
MRHEAARWSLDVYTYFRALRSWRDAQITSLMEAIERLRLLIRPNTAWTGARKPFSAGCELVLPHSSALETCLCPEFEQSTHNCTCQRIAA